MLSYPCKNRQFNVLYNIGYEEDGESSSADLFHPSISKFPKRMTELFLMGKDQPAPKSVDEFMDEIPFGQKKKKKFGRRRLNELSREQRTVMGEINMCYVRKDFDKAWNLCEELIQKGKHVLLVSCTEKDSDLGRPCIWPPLWPREISFLHPIYRQWSCTYFLFLHGEGHAARL